jgi:hypothetical protein
MPAQRVWIRLQVSDDMRRTMVLLSATIGDSGRAQVALAQQAATRSVMRGSALVVLIAFVAAIVLIDGPALRSAYPFLQSGAARAPDIVYWPSYMPAESRPLGMRVTKKIQDGVVEVEIRNLLASGEELRIWGSTRYDASVEAAAGPFGVGPRVAGVLTKWGTGRTQDGRANLLYARIGSTLVVIVGALST